uniref:Sugar ABC transporter permease n=1 Tax=Thermorudis peleae TaxID=1382356 RepID=A0A831TF45_9BACT
MVSTALQREAAARRSRRLITWELSLLLPAVTYIFLLIGFPLLLSIYYSFSHISVGRRDFSFAGLANFRALFSDQVFLQALRNTILITVVVLVVVLVLATILATALAERFRGRAVIRYLLLLPWAAPVVMSTIAWKWVFDSQYSVVNWVLRRLHIIGPFEFPQWLGVPSLAIISIIVVQVWRILPFATVITLAGMTAVPRELIEAALVDGAGFFTRLFRVTLPMIRPIIGVAVLFTALFTFTDMAVVWILTRGGPYNTSHVLASWAFQVGILAGDLARGAAIALFMLPALAVIAVWVLHLVSRETTQ